MCPSLCRPSATGPTAGGVPTSSLRALCVNYQRCALFRCVGTPINVNRPLCAAGLSLRASGLLVAEAWRGAWVILVETLVLLLRVDVNVDTRAQACLVLVEKQLDALQSRELDKELLASLRLSSRAMKKAGLAGETEDAEKVMGELDDQIAQSAELTQVLSTPLETGLPTADTLAFDLDTELGLLETEYVTEAPAQICTFFL